MSKPTGLPESERRRNRRSVVSIEARVHRTDGAGMARGMVRNLSLAGMFIQMADPSGPGTAVDIELMVPGMPRGVRCRGVVVWSRSSPDGVTPGNIGMGVRLIDLGPSDLKLIAALAAGGGG